VLSNDLPDCRALIETYEVGQTVTSDTPAAWRDALRALNTDGTQRFRSGLEKAQSALSWQRESQTLLRIYDELRN
jgi:glycosyltransferase involved in cell wall biosynthesis